jgi:hypothetical protein
MNHDHPLAGYLGRKKTYNILSRKYLLAKYDEDRVLLREELPNLLTNEVQLISVSRKSRTP